MPKDPDPSDSPATLAARALAEARAASLTPERRSEIAKLAARKRWGAIPTAKHAQASARGAKKATRRKPKKHAT